MVIFRSYNDIVVSFLEYLRLVQPNLDTKPGTVSRDLFIDSEAQQLASFYTELRNVSNLQSFFTASGTDLNKLASNFNVQRVGGSRATGVAVLTTNSLPADILIEQGEVVTASNGVSYQVQNTTVMSASSANVYRANASRLRSQLELASITDEFAIEVTVEALTTGLSGNIGRFSLSSQNISGISNVTNLETFSGGSNAETDAQFRTRILSVFAGANTGTVLGYENALSIIPGVLDQLVVVPGDPLLIRDGTQVTTDVNGNRIVSEPGTGGKVDIYLLGTNTQSQVDSFIYNDQSGRDDATDPSNDIILGQRGTDSSLNIQQRRVELIASNTLPFQPVESIISVIGSASGANFVEEFVDENGTVRGNYRLEKDTGDFGGSPFGFDKLVWTSNEINLPDEEVTKGVFNGTDAIDFTNVNRISDITIDVLVVNENSITNNSDRSIIQLRHTPVRNVSRIVNLTTGERYVVEDQNLDGNTGELNNTGRIRISGNTLPVSTDVLQVDYTWIKTFDNNFDYDNLEDFNLNRQVQDSVDWSFANLVVNEPAVVNNDGYGNLTVTLTHPVSKIIDINTFQSDVSTISGGTISANTAVQNIIDIRRSSDNAELFNTDLRNGALSGTTTVILPTDTLAEDGDLARIRFNAVDVFSPDGYDEGSFENNVVTLDSGVVPGGTEVLVNYVANINTLIPETNLTSLPAVLTENKFVINNTTVGNQPSSNLTENGTVTKNLRQAPTNVRVTVDQTGANGSITVSGQTVKRLEDVLVTVTSGSGYEINLSSAILNDLNQTALPSTVKVIRVDSVERVNIDAFGNPSGVDNVYDITNYELLDNGFDLNRSLSNNSLGRADVLLPETPGNTAALLNTGDVVRVTFYYENTSDAESLFFSRNGTQITDKVFNSINRIAIGSGFQNAAGVIEGVITVSNFNQPLANTIYNVDYDYVAPKENERITVTFNNNTLISTATNTIENVRPITADVLIKEAQAKVIDLTARIVVLPEFINQTQTVLQNATDAVISFLNSNSLGTTVDQSDIINTLYTVDGVDRVRIILFTTENGGNRLSISAENNEFLQSGTVNITVEDR